MNHSVGIQNTWELIVDGRSENSRLDQFVEGMSPELSRSRCVQLIRDGWILLNSKTVKPATHVHSGDCVEVKIPRPAPSYLIPQEMSLNVIYEDRHILIVDKPSGLTVHPGPGHPDHTLVNGLLALIPDLPGIGGIERPGIVHRLDKETSGLIVIAKTDVAHRSLTEQLKERHVHKMYLALVRGKVMKNEWEVNAPIGRHPRYRQRMAVISGGRAALTRFVVKSRFEANTLVEAYPVTGRTHQIRVHLAHAGYPIEGDRIYGHASQIIERHFLHASILGFYLPPANEEWMCFESTLPFDLSEAVRMLIPA
jgi:23S rRNA pseudouridine1911/1915/1917 synthase